MLKLPFPLVAYARVSTPHQEGNIDTQIRVLRAQASLLGLKLEAIHEDVGSAHCLASLNGLPGLAAALRQSVKLGAVLLVRDPSRLSRNVAVFQKHVLPIKVKVYSIAHGRILAPGELELEIREAEAEAEAIVAGTKLALGQKTPSRVDTTEMRRRGRVDVLKRQLRVIDDVIVVKRLLREMPGITDRKLCAELLRAGCTPPRGDVYTLDTVRERRREAQKQIALEECEDEQEGLPPAEPWIIGSGTASSGLDAVETHLTAESDQATDKLEVRRQCRWLPQAF